MYKYFVSYYFVEPLRNIGFGNCEVTIDKKITEQNQIIEIQNKYKRETFNDIVILYWRELESEE